MLDALRAGNADRAVETMRGQVIVQGERFADLLAALAADAAGGAATAATTVAGW